MASPYLDSPGYLEVCQANREELKQIREERSHRFHWNCVLELRSAIKEKESQSLGWRDLVKTIVAERSWEKLQRGDTGQPFNSLAELVTLGMELTLEQFLEGVGRSAGPDALELVRPHLPEGVQDKGNNYPVQSPSAAARLEAAKAARQRAEAPALAVRLRAEQLITQEDLERLGHLQRAGRTNEAKAETLELILDRLGELEHPGVTASSTERRHFRAKVREIIQHVIPDAESSKVVRMPSDTAGLARLLRKRLDAEQRLQLCDLLCREEDPEEAAAKPSRRTDPRDLQLGDFTSRKVVAELTGHRVDGGAGVKMLAQMEAAPADETLRRVEGNGWIFRRHLEAELVAKGYAPKSPCWEVVQRGA